MAVSNYPLPPDKANIYLEALAVLKSFLLFGKVGWENEKKWGGGPGGKQERKTIAFLPRLIFYSFPMDTIPKSSWNVE